MRLLSACLGAVLGAGGLPALAAAEVPAAPVRPQLAVPAAHAEPAVTAAEDDPAWNGAPAIPALGPCLGQSAADLPATSVAACWTPGCLFLRFRCADPVVVAAPADGDPYQGDAVEVFIDPQGDGRMYVELQVGADGRSHVQLWLMTAEARSGADGVLLPELIRREQWAVPAWDCAGLRVAARPCAGGWLADVALPAAPLLRRGGTAAFTAQDLRVNLLRLDYAAVGAGAPAPRLLAWSPVAPGRPHRSPQACGTFHLVTSP